MDGYSIIAPSSAFREYSAVHKQFESSRWVLDIFCPRNCFRNHLSHNRTTRRSLFHSAVEILQRCRRSCGCETMIHNFVLFCVFGAILTNTAGPSCSKGGYQYPLDNILQFWKISPLNSIIRTLNNCGQEITISRFTLVKIYHILDS